MKEKHKINLSKHTLPKVNKLQVFKFALYAVILLVLLYFVFSKVKEKQVDQEIEFSIDLEHSTT